MPRHQGAAGLQDDVPHRPGSQQHCPALLHRGRGEGDGAIDLQGAAVDRGGARVGVISAEDDGTGWDWPQLASVMPWLPLITPLKLAVSEAPALGLAEVISDVGPQHRVTRQRVLRPTVKSPLSASALLIVRASPAARMIPPVMVISPVPVALPEPTSSVPAASVMPALRVLLPERCELPLPASSGFRRN